MKTLWPTDVSQEGFVYDGCMNHLQGKFYKWRSTNMKSKKFFVGLTTGVFSLLMSACAGLQSTPIPAAATPTVIAATATTVATATEYHFVTNKLLLPTTQEQSQEFALNIDGDAQNDVDNKFGELLALLASVNQGMELQSTLDQAINSGQLISLHVVQASDPVNDPNVLWSIFLGQSTQSAPVFDGSDQLTLDSGVPVNSPLVGALTNGHFVGGPGMTHIKMMLLGQVVDVDLIGVKLEADFSPNGCTNGKIGGGITSDEFSSNLLPAIASGINQMSTADQTVANTFLPIFDGDGNGTITAEELENNPLLMLAVSPDLDLLDGSGNFNPGQDGVKDSYSAGLGFTCAPAVFTVPE
jgi:hypothetical protein